MDEVKKGCELCRRSLDPPTSRKLLRKVNTKKGNVDSGSPGSLLSRLERNIS